MMIRGALTKAREATAHKRWPEAAKLWLDAIGDERNPVAAWNVGRALLAVQSQVAIKFIRVAAYGGHPSAIDHMCACASNPVQTDYWQRLLAHVTINGQVPPDEAEPLKEVLQKESGANACYIKAWAEHHGLIPHIDFDTARENYGAAAKQGHPLAAVALLRAASVVTYRTAPEETELTFAEVMERVQKAAVSCAPAMVALAEHQLGARNSRRSSSSNDAQGNEARAKLAEAAKLGDRDAMEFIGTSLDPRPPDYKEQRQQAANLGSIRALRALARSPKSTPTEAAQSLTKAVDEELPPTVELRALVKLAISLLEAKNATAALAVLTAADASGRQSWPPVLDEAKKQVYWSIAFEEGKREYEELVESIARGLSITRGPSFPSGGIRKTSSGLLGGSPVPPVTAISTLTDSRRKHPQLTGSDPSMPSPPPTPLELSGGGLRASIPKLFSVAAFLRYAELESEAFQAAVVREKCDTEDVFLRLGEDDLKQLGLALIGERRRFQQAAKAWLERNNFVPPPPPPPPLPPADELDEMVIDAKDLKLLTDKLGEGNFGAVFKGTFNMAKVAVKILYDSEDGKVDDEEFRKEALTLKVLTKKSHPNVLRFFGICKLDMKVPQIKGWCIVTEFMGNGSLKAFLIDMKAKNEIQPHQLYNFSKSAAAGMLHLSSQNPPILHRDLAARNLLVGDYDRTDFTYTLRVADFGLARCEVSGEYSVGGRSAVPIRWTAPEVLTSRKYSVASDVWSFGITLWEIFTYGLRPYPVQDWPDQTLIARITAGERLPATTQGIAIPPDVYKIMLDCWHADPAKRPGFLALHKRLEELEAGVPRGPTPMPSPPTMSLSPPNLNLSSSSSLSTSSLASSVTDADAWDGVAKTFWAMCCAKFPAGIPEPDFIECFKRFHNIGDWARLPENVVTIRCLVELASRQGRVTSQRFHQLLAWFGPLAPVTEFLLRLTKLMQQGWFHGEISSQDAQALVSRPPAPVGCFLMRFSGSELGYFAITLMTRDGKPAHYRVGHERGEYTFKFGNHSNAREIRSPSLRDLVTAVKKHLSCQWPCTPGPYEYLFRDAKAFSDHYGTDL